MSKTPKVRTGFAPLTDSGAIDFTQNVLAKMEGNPRYLNPIPSLDDIRKLLQDYAATRETALVSPNKENTDLKNDAKSALCGGLSGLATYVNLVAKGDKTALDSSGFELVTQPTSVGILPPPTELILSDGLGQGSIHVRFNKVDRALAYLVAYTSDASVPHDQWSQKLFTRTQGDIKNLTRGQEYFFKVAATSTQADASEEYIFSGTMSRISQ